jgi:hypothetical protein
MVVFSNHRLGPGAELLVSEEVAIAMLRATAATARPIAEARWELELVRWLEARAEAVIPAVDVSDIAWTPDHFEPQRQFLIDAIMQAASSSPHGPAFDRWRKMIEAHPRDSVQFGRRWQWQATA